MANKAVFGLYSTRRLGRWKMVDKLRAQGFRNTDISILFPESVGTGDFAHEKGTKAPEGIATEPVVRKNPVRAKIATG